MSSDDKILILGIWFLTAILVLGLSFAFVYSVHAQEETSTMEFLGSGGGIEMDTPAGDGSVSISPDPVTDFSSTTVSFNFANNQNTIYFFDPDGNSLVNGEECIVGADHWDNSDSPKSLTDLCFTSSTNGEGYTVLNEDYGEGASIDTVCGVGHTLSGCTTAINNEYVLVTFDINVGGGSSSTASSTGTSFLAGYFWFSFWFKTIFFFFIVFVLNWFLKLILPK